MICAVCGSTSIRDRTTTFPRSNGPAFAGITTAQPERRALIRPGEEHLAALHLERVRARTRSGRDVPDQAPIATRTLAHACGSGQRSTPLRIANQARRRRHATNPRVLFPILAGERERERAESTSLRVRQYPP